MKKGCKIPLITIGILMGIFILFAILGEIFISDERSQEMAQARIERKRARMEKKQAEIEKKKIVPEETARQEIEDSIKEIFGAAKKADESGIVWMAYAKPTHILDPDCVIRYRFHPLGLFFEYEDELGFKLAHKIKKLYEKHEEIKNIVIRIESPFIDKYGNVVWERVVSFEFSRGLFNRINWHNFSDQDLLKITENTTWHRKP